MPEPNQVWKATVLIPTGQAVDILLDAANPGRWMAHCCIAEHLEVGRQRAGRSVGSDQPPADVGRQPPDRARTERAARLAVVDTSPRLGGESEVLQVVLRVPGMGCRHRIREVTAALRDVPGVATVAVDPRSGSATVGGTMGVAEAIAAVAALGYHAEVVDVGPGPSGREPR